MAPCMDLRFILPSSIAQVKKQSKDAYNLVLKQISKSMNYFSLYSILTLKPLEAFQNNDFHWNWSNWQIPFSKKHVNKQLSFFLTEEHFASYRPKFTDISTVNSYKRILIW